MAELQKNIIENYLKEQGKTKRDLAKALKIEENSINRTLKNPNIALSKLKIIAGFLEVDIIELIPKKKLAQELEGKYHRTEPEDVTNQMTINNLSDALNRNSKTIEKLVHIIAENFPEKIV
jgi:transcriptional regulator with XRE-family HTH domain